MNGRAGSPPSAYRALAQELRSALRQGQYGQDRQLPTEAELARERGLSRQTVRRAMQDLVSDGLIVRVPGRGTFPTPHEGRYLRQFGSVEDLMGLSLDTQLELIVPLHRRLDIEAAGRLRLSSDMVMIVSFRRLHEGLPLCFTTVHLPPHVGRLLADVAGLHEVGATSSMTVLGLLDERLTTPVVEAEQSITVAALPSAPASCLGIADGRAVLRVDRLYLDEHKEPLELATNWFHPELYSYRVRLHRGDR